MDALDEARALLAGADALLVTAGAGMGVDSGLPDFRGDQGFRAAYPPFAKLGLSFVDLASPRWFREDPELAWGFYGHRMHLYRDVAPHRGFAQLRALGQAASGGVAVFTSNVDGQFQRAGFGVVCEVHGSIHHLQCLDGCDDGIWPSDHAQVRIDPETMRALRPLPLCPRCGALARPNVLMFGDGGWVSERTDRQHRALMDWLSSRSGRLVVVECGAGTAVPTVRWFSERVAAQPGAALIRINPREAFGPPGTVSLPLGGAEAIAALCQPG